MLKDWYFKRFAGPIAGTGAAQILLTVTHNEQAIITHIHVINNDTVARSFKMSINADAAGTRIYPPTFFVDANDFHDWQADSPYGGHIIYSGETLEWNANSNLVVTVGGVVALRENDAVVPTS